MLTIAVQKKGRLSEKTLGLLSECGLKFENGGREKLKAKATNFPLTILFLRDDDIPSCVEDGVADAGVIGENVMVEKQVDLNIAERLGFAHCRMSIAVPKSLNYNSKADLEGTRIATSYPNILRGYLEKNNLNAEIHEINGSVEIAPGIGMADVIFDIVSTGSTLISNGLKEVETILRSEAVLVNGYGLSKEKQKTLNDLLFRIRSVQEAKNYKYILLNAPNDKVEDICRILPGMKSPTIVPLAIAGWSSLHSVIREGEFWEVIENLKGAGAEGLLVIPIEKMIQ